MPKGEDSPSEMAHARQSDGISVIFDRKSPASPSARSKSRGGRDSARYRGRGSHKRRHRSSSSSSRSRSSSPSSRSRSHPRCHRRSSHSRCDNRCRYDRGHHRRSPSRRHKTHSRSSKKSASRISKISQSPSKTHRSRSRSRSSGRSAILTLDDKGELLRAAEANVMEIPRVEKLELCESVKPILSAESKWVSLEPPTRVRQDPGRTSSQSSDVDSDDMSSPKMSPERKIISFSINNSVVKPLAAAPSCAKVTPRMDSYESRKPYGHWVPVKSSRTSKPRKHTFATSH